MGAGTKIMSTFFLGGGRVLDFDQSSGSIPPPVVINNVNNELSLRVPKKIVSTANYVTMKAFYSKSE